MTDYLIGILREYPALAIFLTVGLGFLIGKIKFGNFSLGSVTSVLIVGVLIGQADIPMSGPIKSVFFMLFLFSIGYSVGPDFFKSLKGSGGKQALFAIIMSAICAASTLGMAIWMGYTKGETVGMFGGAQTCSSLLGVGSESLERLGLPPAELKKQLDIMPVCYAVTYIFGTLGTVIILGNLGPKLLGGLDKVKRETKQLEQQLAGFHAEADPSRTNAKRNVDYRAYRADSPYFADPKRVEEIEHYLHGKGLSVYIDRCRKGDKILAPGYNDVVREGEEIVACGPSDHMVKVEDYLGTEVSDSKLLSYPLDRIGIVVANKSFIGRPMSKLHRKKYMHGVIIRDAERDGMPLEINHNTRFAKGDRITIVGRPEMVETAASHIGHAERPSVSSDLMFMGLAIFLGGLFGALSIWIGKIPISFGTSGGALLGGLIFGWLRSKRPTYGNISPGALWLMNNLGLNVFIAVVGIQAAPSFVSGIREVGFMLFAAGAAATTLPLLLGLWIGHKIFKFNPAITLGCCAGTRTCTAALGAIQDTLGSTLPAMAYTVTYAVANILLVIWGMLAVNLVP